jgi:NADH:ubiquinone oxidoreductase subunit D
MSRSVGIRRDLRLAKYTAYSGYNQLKLKSFCGNNGDSFDRYLIRMLEMGESLCIINTVSTKLLSSYLNNYQYSSNIYKKIVNKTDKNYTSMEDLIKHFVN